MKQIDMQLYNMEFNGPFSSEKYNLFFESVKENLKDLELEAQKNKEIIIERAVDAVRENQNLNDRVEYLNRALNHIISYKKGANYEVSI